MWTILGWVALAALAQPQQAAGVAKLEPKTLVVNDLYYGLDPLGDCGPSQFQCLDLYLPGVVAPGAPTFVWLHGGGFLGGDKSRPRVQAICNAVARAGAPAVAINYTLADPAQPIGVGASFPQSIHDTKLALRWIRTVGRGFKLSPCILLGGSSSGGILSTLAATAWDVEDLDPLPPAAHAPDLYRPNLVVAFSVLPDLQARGCVGSTIDASCAEGNPMIDCAPCGSVGNGCCSAATAALPNYATAGQGLSLWLGASWSSDCSRFPNALSQLNTWIPSEPYLVASPTHWLGFSDNGALTTGLPDPPIVLVQRRCDLLASPADGAAFRAAAITHSGIVENVDYLDACLACGHGAAEPIGAANLSLAIWNDPETWFAAFSEPLGGYLNCP